MPSDFHNLSRAINQLANTNEAYRDVLFTYRDFLEFQHPFLAEAPVIVQEISLDRAEKLAGEGVPLMRSGAVELDLDWTLGYARKLADYFTSRSRETWEAFNAALGDHETALRDAFEGFLADDFERVAGASDKVQEGRGLLSLPLFVSFVQLSIKPQVLAAAASLRESLELRAWHEGFCPVCGSPPAMSEKNGPLGDWELFCGTCESSWTQRFPHCPFCGVDEPDGVKLLVMEGTGFTIVACDKCKGYVKMVDRKREPDAPDFPLSDLVTLELDIIAANRGFEKQALGVFGI